MRPAVLLLSLLSAPLFLPRQASAQQVVIDPLAEDPSQLRFDPGFIARNAITSIRGEGMVKRDNQPMRDKNEHIEFTFSEAGLPVLTRFSHTRNSGVDDKVKLEAAWQAMIDHALGHALRAQNPL